MKELYAIEICQNLYESLLPEPKLLRVHSVFAQAINLIGEDIFFSIQAGRHSLLPRSCRVQNDIPFTAYGVKEGFSVMASAEMIYITEADLFIKLTNCRKSDLSFKAMEGLVFPEDLSEKVNILKELIREKGCENDMSTLITDIYTNPYAELVGKRLPQLNKAIKEGNLSAIAQAESLAGCGIGLTPSSDDLLIGYMTVYLADSKAKAGDCKKADTITKTLGKRSAEHTNTISGAFLEQCGEGLLSADMKKLMYAIYSDADVEAAGQAGQRILSIGSTSGTDMLTGVVLSIMNLNDGL